jgi:hypothetical protein
LKNKGKYYNEGSDMVFIESVLAILIIIVIFLITYLWFLKHKDKFLHLIIFSSEYDQLKSLDGNTKITLSEASQLYNSTKFLSTETINFSRLQNFQVRNDQETADDIYCITIKLLNLNLLQKVDKVIPGFAENVIHIYREKAFEELSKLQEKDIEVEITISPRFKVDILENIAHYA